MKTRLLIILLLAMCSANSHAQMRAGQGSPPSDSKKKNAYDPVEQLMKKLTPELTLDSFQEAVIRTSLKSQMEKVESIRTDASMSNAEKQDKAVVVIAKTDDEIKAVLNPAQREKYAAYKDKVRGKKKKGKDKDKTEEEVPELIDTPE